MEWTEIWAVKLYSSILIVRTQCLILLEIWDTLPLKKTLNFKVLVADRFVPSDWRSPYFLEKCLQHHQKMANQTYRVKTIITVRRTSRFVVRRPPNRRISSIRLVILNLKFHYIPRIFSNELLTLKLFSASEVSLSWSRTAGEMEAQLRISNPVEACIFQTS